MILMSSGVMKLSLSKSYLTIKRIFRNKWKKETYILKVNFILVSISPTKILVKLSKNDFSVTNS